MKELKKPTRKLNLPAAIERAQKIYFAGSAVTDDEPYGCYTNGVKAYLAELKAGKAKRYFTYDELIEYLDSLPSTITHCAIWRLGRWAHPNSVAYEFYRYASQFME